MNISTLYRLFFHSTKILSHYANLLRSQTLLDLMNETVFSSVAQSTSNISFKRRIFSFLCCCIQWLRRKASDLKGCAEINQCIQFSGRISKMCFAKTACNALRLLQSCIFNWTPSRYVQYSEVINT